MAHEDLGHGNSFILLYAGIRQRRSLKLARQGGNMLSSHFLHGHFDFNDEPCSIDPASEELVLLSKSMHAVRKPPFCSSDMASSADGSKLPSELRA